TEAPPSICLALATCGLLLLLRGAAGLLGAIFRSSLLAVRDALCVEHAAHDMVAHAGQIFHTPAPHQHHRVLLQGMALARDVGGDLHMIGQPDARDLAQRRVWLLRGHRLHLRADAALERRAFATRQLALVAVVGETQRGRLYLLYRRLA